MNGIISLQRSSAYWHLLNKLSIKPLEFYQERMASKQVPEEKKQQKRILWVHLSFWAFLLIWTAYVTLIRNGFFPNEGVGVISRIFWRLSCHIFSCFSLTSPPMKKTQNTFLFISSNNSVLYSIYLVFWAIIMIKKSLDCWKLSPRP